MKFGLWGHLNTGIYNAGYSEFNTGFYLKYEKRGFGIIQGTY